jgi:hypothetical protein
VKSAGRPRVSEERVERVRQSSLRSLKKSVRHANRELDSVEGVEKETGNEALSSSFGAVSVETITPDMLIKVWQELDYRLDVCRVTKGAYIEHMQDRCCKLVELLFHFHCFVILFSILTNVISVQTASIIWYRVYKTCAFCVVRTEKL